MYHYQCTVVRVIDGDTVEALIDLGFHILYKSAVRLKGINAPEMHGKTASAGAAAWTYLIGLLKQPGKLTILTELGKDTDKYGRVLGTFFIDDKININAEMIRAGHAINYMV